MWPDRVSNSGPLTYKSGDLPTALRGPASGRLDAGNDRLCAMEPSYWLERFPHLAGFEPGTARAAGQGFTYWATGLPKVYEAYVHIGSNLKVLIAHPCRMFFFFFFFFFMTFFFLTELSTFMPI